MDRHVLVLGGMRHLHRVLAALPAVRSTLIIDRAKVKPVDFDRHGRVLGAAGGDAEVRRLATAVHGWDPFDAVIAFDDRAQPLAAGIASALGLPYHSAETIAAVDDKHLMRELLRRRNPDALPSEPVADAAQLADFAQRTGYPVILKPRRGLGSTGVCRIDAPEAVPEAWLYATAEWPAGDLTAEKFITGPEFSVEALSQHGEHRVVAITEKHKDPETFVELGHAVPADLPAPAAESIAECVRDLLEALGIRDGPTHTEVILSPRGPQVVETHVRLGGDFIPELVQEALDVPIIELAVRAQLGEPILADLDQALKRAADRGPARGAAIWFRADRITGTLVSLDHGDLDPRVIAVDELKGAGDELRPVRNSFDRIAAVRAAADSAAAAMDIARSTARSLDLVVRLGMQQGAGEDR